MYEGETIVCEGVVCEEIVKQLCMGVNELCVRKLRAKELCVKELGVQKIYVCVRKPASQATRLRARRDVQQSQGCELTGQCLYVCPARRISLT